MCLRDRSKSIVKNIVANVAFGFGLCLSPVMAFALNSDETINKAAIFWPDAQYDENVPTIKQVLGYDNGEKITTPSDMIK